jgi:biotin-dependent carboxylase-like uncharacterized protein
VIEVLTAGPQALLQDLGRTGYRELGVGRSGAADDRAHRLANRLVGNAETAATIEITLGGLAFRLLHAATIALTGARCTGGPAWHTALSLPPGAVVALGLPAAGLRSYLAIRGGFAVEPVLGSRATDTLSGLGPAPLAAGDRLPTGEAVLGEAVEASFVAEPVGPIRVLPGPRLDWFAPDALTSLLDAEWTVSSDSNRVGIRLAGPALVRVRKGELPTEPTLPGAIQVPPNGQPILLGPDAPVTGGYPVIAVVSTADLYRLGQLRPGSPVHFH